MADKTASRPTQFSLRWLFGITTLLAAVFAILTALGTAPVHTLVGFAAIGGVAAVTALVVEAIARVLGYRAESSALPW